MWNSIWSLVFSEPFNNPIHIFQQFYTFLFIYYNTIHGCINYIISSILCLLIVKKRHKWINNLTSVVIMKLIIITYYLYYNFYSYHYVYYSSCFMNILGSTSKIRLIISITWMNILLAKIIKETFICAICTLPLGIWRLKLR